MYCQTPLYSLPFTNEFQTEDWQSQQVQLAGPYTLNKTYGVLTVSISLIHSPPQPEPDQYPTETRIMPVQRRKKSLTLDNSGLRIAHSSLREPPREMTSPLNTEKKSMCPKIERLDLCIRVSKENWLNRKQDWTPFEK